MTEKLKPCPFCGSEAELTYNVDYDFFTVGCSNHHSLTMCCDVMPSTRICDTREEAISLWNKRAKETE